MSTSQLRDIATGASAPRGANALPTNFPAMLDKFKNEIARALPRHLNADTMARIALTSFRMNRKLAECHPASVFAAVIQASQLGLRPGLMAECFLIPYKDQCTLQIGYQGLLELVRRSGFVESIGAYLVHANDEYEVHFGTDPGVTHKPCLEGDPGPLMFGYAVAKIKGGGTHVEVMTMRDIERIRDRSQNVIMARRYDKQTPWDTDFEEMARKTLMRRICKYLPKSPDIALAVTLDDSAAAGRQVLTVEDAIGGSFVPSDIEGTSTEKPAEDVPNAGQGADLPEGLAFPHQAQETAPQPDASRRAAMLEADRKIAEAESKPEPHPAKNPPRERGKAP
jgi:recombination protein RecT